MPRSSPEVEAHRLEALRSYRVLDTPAERAFDDLVRLAAKICQTPIALLVLVDRKRLWFKASVGYDVTEVPRAGSLCNAAIEESDLLHVPDASRDVRFAQSPVVTGAPDIRCYAGVPLRNRDGFALGTLCVIDPEPHEIDEEKLESLRALARQAVRLLESRRTLIDLTETIFSSLPGVIPICSHCKSIRDETETWVEVDRYLVDRAGLQLTHGICETCRTKHFPKVDLEVSEN